MSITGRQAINIGLPNQIANSDTLYAAFNKIESNFVTIFEKAVETQISLQGSVPDVNVSPPNDPQQVLNQAFPQRVAGFAVLDATSRNLWIFNGQTWNNAGPIIGRPGFTGSTGFTGSQGIQGPPGPTGPVGPTGSQGAPASKFTATIGDGINTTYSITHNLGTRDLGVFVFENSGNYVDRIPDIERPTINSINIIFATAPTVNQYRVVIIA